MRRATEDQMIDAALREATRPARTVKLRTVLAWITVACLAASLGWVFRRETLAAGKDSAYLMNRWTGEIVWVYGDRWFPVVKGPSR